jgi:Manganese containing catalase
VRFWNADSSRQLVLAANLSDESKDGFPCRAVKFCGRKVPTSRYHHETLVGVLDTPMLGENRTRAITFEDLKVTSTAAVLKTLICISTTKARHTIHVEITSMYHHVKKLMYTVNIGEPDVRFGNMLLEQFGGANGELAAAMQYTIQGWNCVDDIGRRDLLMGIGTEELSHLEVVGALIRMHLKPLKTNREAAEADPPRNDCRRRRIEPF